MFYDSRLDAEQDELIEAAIRRGIFSIDGDRITYRLNRIQTYNWNDPEEWVRAYDVAFLVLERNYPTNRIKLEVSVWRRVPVDYADIVVYRDDRCRDPYLVVECKAAGIRGRARDQAIEQLFGNSNSLRTEMGLYDDGERSIFFDIANYPAGERVENRRGDRTFVPTNYGDVPQYAHIAGAAGDIQPATTAVLVNRVRRAHNIIWAGGKRDPLQAFDEWSKLLFAKVADERHTPTGQPRRFQQGSNETVAAVANRVHDLFDEAARVDPSIFPPSSRIGLTDAKVAQVVQVLQGLSFTGTDVDSIGRAFEEFFGSIFRGGLGQYFTMRQLARFTVAFLSPRVTDYVLDPTSGSGGFLLEVLLQTWHEIERSFRGQAGGGQRQKMDFALGHVYGIEIHEILARICKINLLLHHDGHTNIEADRSCLDSHFDLPRLNREGGFTLVVGNPPFGDEVKANDEDHLGANSLDNFEAAAGRDLVDSEHVIVEQAIKFLEPGGRFGLILPDGFLNNPGHRSNCPWVREFVAKSGRILAIVSLPDHAFRKSGAQNKTSILFFQKFTRAEKRRLERSFDGLVDQYREEHELDAAEPVPSGELLAQAYEDAGLDYQVFLAEANHVGYTPSGAPTSSNDLYRPAAGGMLAADQSDTILGEWRTFQADPENYEGRVIPDCMSASFTALWNAHSSHRLDPKYHLFEREMLENCPDGWVRGRIGDLLQQRTEPVSTWDPDREYLVLTISQEGTLRPREAGKGNTPPRWTGDYFQEVSPGDWFQAHTGDLVYSSIDLWKGCIAVVTEPFDGGLVTKEFPIFRIVDERLSPRFLQLLLRSRYFQRAFRAITTGHSNRRRCQIGDFEDLEIFFPESLDEQNRLVENISAAEGEIDAAKGRIREALLEFDNLIDGRGDEQLPELEAEENEEAE